MFVVISRSCRSISLWAAIDIGLFKSDVLSTRLISKFSRAPVLDEAPVPPLVRPSKPVNFVADIDLIFGSVTFSSNILTVVMASALTKGSSAVPVKSPANRIIPLTTVVALPVFDELIVLLTKFITAFVVG